MLIAGLMSGTSLDGIDAVLVDITGTGINTKLEVIEFIEYEMPQSIRNRIKTACNENDSSVDLICSLNFELGKLFSDAVTQLLKKANVTDDDITCIASHGQTIYHIPQAKNNLVASTLQIGEPAVIAYEHNTTVISNFRVMDMAANGQGAPLVPYSEWILYSNNNKNIALQNIGGIGNVTVLPKTLKIDEVFAFDTGPGNIMINESVRILFNKPFDDNGNIASQGTVIQDLLDELMSHPYLQTPPPKSTGREDFGEVYVQELINKFSKNSSYDIVATFTKFTATSMKYHYSNYIFGDMDIDQIIIGGGGSHNTTLLNYIREEFAPIEVVTQDDIGYSSDAKEAIAFTILANETLNGKPSNVPNATGAEQFVILGNITPKPQL